MFGYVRPVREELKCKDFDLYRATYCGLCRELRRKYGLLAPMFLNFDFTFLALLLWPAEQRFVPCRGRCHANPLARKEMCPADPALASSSPTGSCGILLGTTAPSAACQPEGWPCS